MHTLLIANRGEIAVRIIRAARELGLRTVAVYSEVDYEAPHAQLADAAFCLGPPEPAQSYLDSARLLEIARRSGADAVHPGYGFLAENAAFAEDCRGAGLLYVGPTPEAIRLMGSKILSKQLAASAGVPVVPSYHAPDMATLARQAPAMADRFGYPVLVKASAGGGGKGMRVVEQADDLLAALEAGAREAQQAFGDGTLLLEKYLHRPRHIEVQILGDHAGQRLHLFERECSIQRRHQKIIEESPSPAVDAALRQRLTSAALRLAEAVHYTNAGTVEFLLDPEGNFYFLEMNTRLQVEHPITECVTGIDLVQAQLRIARGEPLGYTQSEVSQRGHAIECRLYAEDPAQHFLPATGRIRVLREPHGPGRRIDSGIALQQEITPYYDPILAKLVCSGATRQEAILRMQALLADYTLLGVTTNRQFLLDVLRSEAFAAGTTDTDFLRRHFPAWQPASHISDEMLAVAALGDWLQRQGQFGEPLSAGRSAPAARLAPSPWQRYDGWRLGGQR
ncbi:MAG: acetyl/propionyl/methylcrotonyl-CoA carboxylase subunit alpha [Candidatus Tectimicrobiota bacterium]